MELGRGQNREAVRANRIRPQGNAYAFSGIQYFTTDSKNTGSEYQCGMLPSIDISNKNLLQNALGTNEVFMAGDFPVTVLQSQGTSGTYTGYGYIEVPYLADTKIKVTFSNIQLNTDKQLIGGILETTYDVNESSLSYVSQGIGETFGDRGVESVIVDYTISEIQYVATPPPGRIIITGNSGKGNNDDSGNGESSRQELPSGKDYVITDKDGNVWHVDEEGNVTKGEKVAEGGASNAQNTEGITGSGSNAQVSQYTAKGVNVEWHETTETKYAYDTADKLPELKDKYPTVKDADGNTVYVSYKAVVNRSEDVFGARITFTDEALKDRKIIFKTLKIGQEIVAQKSPDNDYVLTLKGTMNYAEEDIIAVLMPNDSIQKQQVIGSFKLVHLEPKEINVTLVPTDEVSKGKLANIRKETNAIYSKVGVTINFNEDEVFDIKPYLDGKEDILTEKNTLLSTYSSVQQAINNAYGERNSDRYVLFVTNKESSTGQMGYMRLSGRFGYIFKSPTSKTVAHEIGHGVFKLEHPWEKYKISESSTDLLMDYSQGTNLFHLDWKQINDPALKFYMFQGKEEGERVENLTFVLDEDGLFITPDRRLVKLPKDSRVFILRSRVEEYNKDNKAGSIDFPNGALYSFKADNKYYNSFYDLGPGAHVFKGYYEAEVKGGNWRTSSDNPKRPIPAYEKGKYAVSFLHLTKRSEGKYRLSFIVQDYEYDPADIDVDGFNTPAKYTFDETKVKEYIDFTSTTKGNSIDDKIITEGTKTNNSASTNQNFSYSDPKGNYTVDATYNPLTKKWDAQVKYSDKYPRTKTRKIRVDGQEVEVVENIEDVEKQVSDLASEKLNELGDPNGEKSKQVKQATEDGGDFWVKDMNGLEWIGTISDLGANVWDKSALPENYWNKDKEYDESTIHFPPTLSGISDGVIEEVLGLKDLVKLGYDVATKEEIRIGLWEGIKDININFIKEGAIGFYEEKKEKYTSDKDYIVAHTVSKDVVQVASMFLGGGVKKGLQEGAENAVEKGIKNTGETVRKALKNKLDNLKKYFDSEDFVKRLDNRWAKYKGKLSRADWENRYKQLIINRDLGRVAEDAFQDVAGGIKPTKAIRTSDGKRYFDNVLDGTAREVKSGPVSFSKYKDQIMKDIEILKRDLTNGQINKIEWHCFDGVDDTFENQLKMALKEASLPDDAIKYIDYIKELD